VDAHPRRTASPGGIAAALRKLRFDGDITTYIRRLSIVVVRFVNESCEYYNHVFDDDLQSSGSHMHVRRPRPPAWCWLTGAMAKLPALPPNHQR